jgi:hypothetical protein
MAPCFCYDLEEETYMQLHLEEPTASMRREVVQLNCRLAALHAQMAWMNSQIVPTQPPLATAKRTRIHNKKIRKPDGAVTSPTATCDKSQQTVVWTEKVDHAQQTESCIFELKKANRKIIVDLLPYLRDPLECCAGAKEETMLYFKTLMGEHDLHVRPHLQDAIVLFVVEKYGHQNRKLFEDGLGEIFGGHLDEWRSRLHNSLFHTIRMNMIPCFGRKQRNRKSKSSAFGAPKVIAYGD